MFLFFTMSAQCKLVERLDKAQAKIATVKQNVKEGKIGTKPTCTNKCGTQNCHAEGCKNNK